MAFDRLISETTDDGVLVLTMNDPHLRNAMGEPMMSELLSELDRLAADPALRALVLTGAGSAFCSGANVRSFAQEIAERPPDLEGPPPEATPQPWERVDPVYAASQAPADPERSNPLVIRKLHSLQKPSFAAVNGPAVGLGCGIALACDFRVAGDSARFVEAFVTRGVTPADGDAWRLPKLIGMSNALWMLYSGEPVTAAEAYRLGLANWLVADDELMGATIELATRLARGAAYAQGVIKQLVLRSYEQDFPQHLELASRAFGLTRASADHEEGVRAFLEKRAPDFRNVRDEA
jgi:2-(1,2-epoxy-1,2-dihydrophenyl)acetyl-CoA isomerase